MLIYIGVIFLSYCKVCKVCRHRMKQIPMRKTDSYLILEYYCPYCDESDIRYENLENM